MKLRFALKFLTVLALSVGTLHAQTIWTDADGNSLWSDSGNWSNGVPGSSTDVQIGTMQPGDDIVGIDTGVNVTVASFTFNSSLNTITNPPVLVESLGEQLTITGNILNSSSLQNQFDLTLNAGGAATYTGGTAGLVFDFLNVNTQTIATSGTIIANGTLVFDINSLSTYGKIGSITATGATINIAGTYAGHAGDSFNLLTSGNFSGATLGTLPTLSPGLQWNTSNFLSSGVLSVQAVPEPSTYGMLGLGLGICLLMRYLRLTRKTV